jgi:predicted ATPase/class 3 adenylate cyclase
MNSNPRTATFLFTDLENSTPLWENHPDLMQGLAARHDALLREAITAHSGRVVKTTGDGFHSVFEDPSDGVAAALAGQQAMIREAWPAETGQLQVRMGLHTGESQERDGDYYGPEVNRAARVMGVANGGQILISEATAALILHSLPPEISLLDLGEHRLRGLAVTEHISQICHPILPFEFPALNSLSVYQHNLPMQLTSFVGRGKEMAEVHRLLKETRLLTLLGPGGTGKTRLMLECAEEVVGDYADGVWLVELAPLTDPDLTDERVAAALNVQEQPSRSIRESLVDYLRRKELLLLLDNVEHLVRQSAELAQHLLTHCTKLKIMVTGREALFIPGEVTLQIPSLSLPSGSDEMDLEEIQDSEGCKLFLARAQEVRPDFELHPENATAVADIVRRLDGIPLALELATARLRMLSVDQIAERLHDRFRLLTGGRRTALPHQQTLQALIDWSWKLLDEKEQLLLRRLSIFSGGWTLEAAQAVAVDDQLDEFEVFDRLEQLVNKSLVTVSHPPAGEARSGMASRFGMLESIHQYGRDRLIESGEGEMLRDRHADYFVAFAEEAGPHLVWSLTRTWVRRIVADLDNLRAVLNWTLEERPELALRIAANIFYNEVHSLTPREARSWLEPAIEKARVSMEHEGSPFRPVDYLKALIGLGIVTGIQGGQAKVHAMLEEATLLAWRLDEPRVAAIAIAGKQMMRPFTLSIEERQEMESAIDICRRNQHHFELFNLLLVYAFALDVQGSSELAKPLFREAVELSHTGKVRHDATIFISVQFGLARLLEDFEEEKRFISNALEKYQALKHRRGTVIGQGAMAHLLRREEHFDEAKAFYNQSIVGWQELGHKSAVAHQIECFAYIAIERGQHVHAARLLGAAGEARRRLDALSQDPQEISELARAMEQLAEVMGKEERDRAVAEGRLIELDSAVEIALGKESWI